MPNLSLSVQYADIDYDWSNILPRPLIRRWVKSALQKSARLTIRFVGESEAKQLNNDYRAKNYATNVLTFAYNDLNDDYELPKEVRLALAQEQREQIEADIVLCGEVLKKEATEQGKSIIAHAAHLIIHGVLHAQGFDHVDDGDAELMEAFEVRVLTKLGFNNPYSGDGVKIKD